MKIVQIYNAWESKTGTSINFRDCKNRENDNKYSFRKSLISNIDEISINSLNGMSIELIDFKIKDNGWIMIDDFEFVDDSNSADVKKEELNVFQTSDNNWELNLDDIQNDASVPSYESEIIDRFEKFSPFSEKNEVFADSYMKNQSYKCSSFNLRSKTIPIEAEISVIQNFINRSKSAMAVTKGSPSAFVATVILELVKYSINEPVYFTLPKKFAKSFDDTIDELLELLKIYSSIFVSNTDVISQFIKKIIVVEDGENEVIISTDNETFLTFEISSSNDKFPPCFITDKSVEYKDLVKNKASVDKLLYLAFYNNTTKISSFKGEQIEALNRIVVLKTNVLAMLKTGFGKSLIYQFLTLLQPNIFLCVFPIVSLIEDQTNSLTKDHGLTYVISNQEIKDKKNRITKSDMSHKRLFMITAERMEDEKIQNIFIKFSNFIGAVIFDEAHCISEWGHDFRPAYLVVRHFIEGFKEKNSKFRILALTATAAPYIQKDVMSILGIPSNGLVNIADSTGLRRDELKFKILKEDDGGTFASKNSVDQHWLEKTKEIYESNPSGDGLGIVYFLYSGGDGSSPYRTFSARSAFEYVCDHFDSNSLGLYTGKLKITINDGEEKSPASLKDYENLEMIFATKSFGMGINLKRCNYVAFANPPSSLEDLYQQAGRAGRAGQKSLIEIYYSDRHLVDPVPEVSQTELKNGDKKKLQKSSYSFFLKIDEKRTTNQPIISFEIISKIISSSQKEISINLYDFYTEIKTKYDDVEIDYVNFNNNVKFAIAHLITEFGLINYYNVEYAGYSGTAKIKNIKMNVVGIDKTQKNVEKRIQDVLKKYSITRGIGINENIPRFYVWYFEKIQRESIIGFNIFRHELKNIDNKKNLNHTDLINDIITNYYKSRSTSVDNAVYKIYSSLVKNDPFEVTTKIIDQAIQDEDAAELNETVSRYSISRDYIYIVSLYLWIKHGIDPIIDTLDSVIGFQIENQRLAEIKNNILFTAFLNDEIDDNTSVIEYLLTTPNKNLIKLHKMKKALEGVLNE